ncbi:MAG: hypothetical protein AB1552_03505 [Nitrospirota bacterium]
MSTDPIAYLMDAIKRVEAGSLSGSHVAGIFGKAAKTFEKEVRSYTLCVLKNCSLNYETDLRSAINGPNSISKLTLGNLVALIEKSLERNKPCIDTYVPGGWKVVELIDALKQVNKVWVEVKHGDDVDTQVLLVQLKTMLNLFQLIRAKD